MSNQFDASPTHTRVQSQPLLSAAPQTQQPLLSTAPSQSKRTRASSDPFLDTPAVSRSAASSPGNSLLGFNSEPLEDPVSPISPVHDAEEHAAPSRPDLNVFDETEDGFLRKWTSPDLSNPEYIALLDLFPGFTKRRAVPYFPVARDSRHPDIEEAEDERGEGKEIRFGTGTMWVSPKLRREGWEGGWWSRFLMWWRRTFAFC
jgi:hypothetical protein